MINSAQSSMTLCLGEHLEGKLLSVETEKPLDKDTACCLCVAPYDHQENGWVSSVPCIVFSYRRWENKQLCDSPDGLCMKVFQKGDSLLSNVPQGLCLKVLGWDPVCKLEKPPTHTISGTMPTI